jgi:hypothetical protein
MRDTRLWYFAYGANMATTVLARRAVQPTRSAAATLANYALCFNHPGLPPLEPVFANVEPAPGATVYGVAHLITPGEAAIFDSLEPNYRRITVYLQLADGETVQGFAYASERPGPEGIPSARYLGLLLEGGREYGFPDAVIAGWEGLRARASTASLEGPSTARERVIAQPTNLPADLVDQWKREQAEDEG